MSSKKECIAMILAGGRGENLGSLTNYMAKPTIPFGCRNRVIDFSLSNCKNSGIHIIGILSQYFSTELHSYIYNGHYWDSNRRDCNITMCPSGVNKGYYAGTADAVYKNIEFIERFSPEHVLLLSGDHVYKMDYRNLLDFHVKNDADVTLAATSVPWEETYKYGILQTDDQGIVLSFEEGSPSSRSNLASMGVYLFRWSALKKHLIADHNDALSKNDVNKDLIPEMFFSGKRMLAYRFPGYWRNVGTVDGLWEAHMDLIDEPEALDMKDESWKILSGGERVEWDSSPAALENSNLMIKPTSLRGRVKHSVLYKTVTVGEGSEVVNSILMPNVAIGKNVKINKAIVGPGTKIMDGVEIGANYGTDRFIDTELCSKGITLVSPYALINEKMTFQENSHIDMSINHSLIPFRHSLHYGYYAHPI